MTKPESFKIQHIPRLLVNTGKSWYKGDPFKHSAIVAYYGILSLPALIIIILKVVGSVWGEDLVQGELLGEISSAIGPDAADAIGVMINNRSSANTSVMATIIGIGTLLYGSTGVFFQVQSALDNIWGNHPKYENSLLATIVSRAKSFGFILVIGFLLLVSLVLTSLLSTFSRQLNELLPEDMFDLLFLVDLLVSVGFIYILFATMFKYLPSARIPWKSVRVGAALTTVMFMIGKYLLALYFNTMEPGSTYGAAGSIILIMLWVSYSSLILLFGAHFTKQYADKYLINPESVE